MTAGEPAMTGSEMVDQALVTRGLARSRAVARDLVLAGRVRSGADTIDKPSVKVTPDTELEVVGEVDPWVGRAAHKLLGALAAFGEVDPAGLRAIDVGASTGGFTQVLLSRGAAVVEAVDVGHGQLAPAVRDDDRVRDHSGTTVRGIDPETIGGPADLVVTDLSFISLTLVAADLARLLTDDGHLVALVKPQFEVGRERLGHGGVVRSPRERARAVRAVLEAIDAAGLTVHGLDRSVVAGTTGNQEYLLWARKRPAGKMDDAAIAAFVTTIEQEDG
ncbi:TlyA family RNA methyltransferase [Calidifontibacter indicus]|nr:TlyA family RNA methyltransferase [Calidifontibacter indicus]